MVVDLQYSKEDLEQMEFEDFLDRRDESFGVLKIRLTARKLVNESIGLYYVPCITENLQIRNFYYFFDKELVLNVECVDRETQIALLDFHKRLPQLKSREEFFELAHHYFAF